MLRALPNLLVQAAVELAGHVIAALVQIVPERRHLDETRHIAPRSHRKIQALRPRTLLIPHNGLYMEETPDEFFQQSLFWAERIKNMVVDYYRRGASKETIIQVFKSIYYYQKIGRQQIEEAFLLNASIMVRMLLRECLGVDIDS